MREEDARRIRQPLIYSGFFLLSRGEKAGKQVIRSTGLSIEVEVGGTWRECTTPIPFALIRVLSTASISSSTSCVLSGRMRLLLFLPMPLLSLLPLRPIATAIAIRGQQAQISIFPSASSASLQSLHCALVLASAGPFVRHLTWFFNLVPLIVISGFPFVRSFLPPRRNLCPAREEKRKIQSACELFYD